MRDTKIVILGAGVAGLRVAQKLGSKLRHGEASVTLIDENPYHQLLYKLHEVCNIEYEEKEIVVPLNRLINNIDDIFIQTKVEEVDTDFNQVHTSVGTYPYDILVIALGSHSAFFNIDGIVNHSKTLASYDQAKDIRARILELFAESEVTGVPPSIVIGGAGFTGVELAGEMIDWLPLLYKEHGLEEKEPFFTMVEAFSHILPGWDDKLIEKVHAHLVKRGINIHLNDPVVEVGDKKLELRSGTVLEPDLFIWTGGVESDPVCRLGFQLRGRRIIVDDYLQYAEYDGVFVLGDMACTVDNEGKPMPPNAHIAMSQADIVAHNIMASIKGNPLKKYRFAHAGEVVTVGRKFAVGELFGIRLTGFPARFMKRFIHIWYLHSIGGLGLALEGL